MRVLSYTTERLRKIQTDLEKDRIFVGYVIIGKLLNAMGYCRQIKQNMLQAGKAHPDRNAQFDYINATATGFLETGDPENRFYLVSTGRQARLISVILSSVSSYDPTLRGVSSVISALRIQGERYTTRLKCFRSTSFDIDGLYQKLIPLLLKILPPKP